MDTQSIIDNFLAKVSDPKYFGPILWYNIHLLSKEAKTQAETKHFYEHTLKKILEGIRCAECRTDALLYYATHPMKWKDQNSAFDWTYDFHTYVNYKLGKPNIDKGTYYNLYSGGIPLCTDKCGMPGNTTNTSTASNVPSKIIGRRMWYN